VQALDKGKIRARGRGTSTRGRAKGKKRTKQNEPTVTPRKTRIGQASALPNLNEQVQNLTYRNFL
jgi:hypothetical protein